MSDVDSDVVDATSMSTMAPTLFTKIFEYKSANATLLQENDEKYLSKWIEFNLLCIKKDFGKELKQKDFYDDSNLFFKTFIFSCFKKKKYNLVVEEGLEQCPKCYSFKILSEQVQKRSADEGMTNIFNCFECNWTWEK